MIRFAKCGAVLLGMLSFSAWAAPDPWTATLDSVENQFEANYCFKDLKRELFGWDGHVLMDQTRAQLEALGPYPNPAQARHALQRFYDSTRDIHVSPRYVIDPAFTRSTLGVRIRSASDGRFYIVAVNPALGTPAAIQIGDEVLRFNGATLPSVRAQFLPQFFSQPRTQVAIAEEVLTDRFDVLGHALPSGTTSLVLRNHLTGATGTFTLTWTKTARSSLRSRAGGRKRGLSYSAEFREDAFGEDTRAPAAANPVANYSFSGARSPFFPDLGPVLWRTAATDPLDAYSFRLPNGKIGGFVRIGSYFPNDIFSKVTPFFGSLMSRFAHDGVSVLVYDQTNNSGGSLLYSEDLMRSLIAEPVRAPLSVEWIVQPTNFEMSMPWSDLRDLATAALTDPAAREKFQNEIFIDKVLDDEFIHGFIAQAEEMLALLRDPNHPRLMRPSPFEGQSWIRPTNGTPYLGPILMLGNELSVSAADLTPALFQDLRRAAFFGEKTAGAGAYQNSFAVPAGNPFGLVASALSFGKFNHADGRPVENHGTLPNFPYSVTARDLQNEMHDYRDAVVRAALSIAR
jgi:hypothetical protein